MRLYWYHSPKFGTGVILLAGCSQLLNQSMTDRRRRPDPRKADTRHNQTMEEADVLELALAAKIRSRHLREHSTPISHRVVWMEPPPEHPEPKRLALYHAVRDRAQRLRMNSVDLAESVPVEAQPSSRAARRFDRQQAVNDQVREASASASLVLEVNTDVALGWQTAHAEHMLDQDLAQVEQQSSHMQLTR